MQDKEEQDKPKLHLEKLSPILNGDKNANLPFFSAHCSVVVFSRHRFYRHLVIDLIQAKKAKNAKLKNPFLLIDPMDRIWKTDQQDEIKFLAGLARFKNNYEEGKVETEIEALKAIVANPLNLDFYIHDEKKTSVINASTIISTKFHFFKPDLEISIDERSTNYAISGQLHLGGRSFCVAQLVVRYRYFVEVDHELYLIDNPNFLYVIDFFKQNQDNLILERDEYEKFQQEILLKLEEEIRVTYSYLRPATKKQYAEQGFDLANEQVIYLSESEDFVLLTLVMKYGGLEIPVISKKQIQAKDKRGKLFKVERDEAKELQFINFVGKMHPQLMEQVKGFSTQLHADSFYMHRQHFLEPTWFLNAFEAWRSKGIAILGFNELRGNVLSGHQADIKINVISGIDWFETSIKIKFNKELVSLKNLHKSIRNKSKFVQLDDGTMGILPEEWLQKFEGYFSIAEVKDDVLVTPNISYAAITELYDEELLDLETQARISSYRDKLSSFNKIDAVVVDPGLKTTLRSYQQDGLNWLNFLDDFNFGGCLADDMGLGKTVQIIAFILSQNKKVQSNTNLIVVPASLVFNWQQEISKFAPSLKVLTIHGNDRSKIISDFDKFEIILTSYGTLLADIRWLKDYHFNYIILDESQNIKNPDSQRYKAARLLSARNRLVLTGTPIENSILDLYGQFSFACRGLLGSRAQFKMLYAVPIDQFKDAKRAAALQNKINPFLLRRTKQQVAKELPEKTEMVIYCELGEQQREIYESCRQDIRAYLMGTADDELNKSSMHVLQGITKLRQICNSPALLGKQKFYGDASAKMDVLLEQIESKAPYHKILVFSQFVGMLDLIKIELEKVKVPFTYLTGQTKNREEVVASFQDDEKIRVFLISLKAGGVGLNLTKADYVFLIDPWWNPAVENQAIDRAHRIGQNQNVMAVRLICPDTIEEKIMLMQNSKKDLVSDLIKTEQSIFKSLSKDEILNLI